MSTRYVWGKFEIAQNFKTIRAEQTATSHQRYSMGRLVDYNGDEIYGAVAFCKKYPYGNGIDQVNLSNDRFGVGDQRVAFSKDTTSFPEDPQGYYAYIWGAGTLYIENGIVYATNPGDDSSEVTAGPYVRKKVQEKGSSLGYVSSATDGQYPADGVSGNVWYTKQGSDNIDAASVSIPSTIMGGTEITITVTPGSGKVYAGTVSYIYQVKLGSGSWQTIATTTATTRTYTVPYGTESIQVRVQAKDDIGFTSSDYATSSAVTVINNQPPTAPGSIEVTNVVSGQQCTITITASTDPDGTVASYIYERSVDGSAWQQIANVNALTYNDTINAEWGTVAYRAKAVDDDGDSGPYVTSQTSVVNSGWVIISGPSNDMGDKPAPFEFEISVSISGQETSDNITVDITLDGKSVYSQAVAPNTPISIDVDTRTMRTGSHSFAVAASCDTYVPASGEYTFNVPEITIPDGGRMDQLEGQDGNVIFPITLARAVAGLENYGVESKVHPGAYTGTGTFGTDNPNSLEFEFEPKMVLIQGTAGRVAILIKPSGVGVSIGPNESTTLNVTWQGKTVSWYNALNAANQMNTENENYSYTAFG